MNLLDDYLTRLDMLPQTVVDIGERPKFDCSYFLLIAVAVEINFDSVNHQDCRNMCTDIVNCI